MTPQCTLSGATASVSISAAVAAPSSSVRCYPRTSPALLCCFSPRLSPFMAFLFLQLLLAASLRAVSVSRLLLTTCASQAAVLSPSAPALRSSPRCAFVCAPWYPPAISSGLRCGLWS